MSTIRDRDGSLIEVPDDDRHDCNGWLGEDSAGRPIPCPRCRKETVQRLRAQQDRIANLLTHPATR